MADESGSLRLSSPQHQMYDTTVGEASVLRGITPENIGGLYGLLLNQRALGASARGEYNDQLRGVNEQQYRLNQTKLDDERLKNLREASLAAVDKGHASLGNMRNLRDLFVDPRALAQTDATRAAGYQAGVVKDLAGAADNLSSSGMLQPGANAELTPEGLARASSGPVGVSRALQVAQEGSRGQITAAGLHASGTGGARMTIRAGMLPGDSYEEYSGRDPTAVRALAAEGQAARERGRDGGTGGGGNNTPPPANRTGPAAGAGGGTAPTATSSSGVRSYAQAKEAARALGLPPATRFSNAGSSWTAILPDGTRRPLR